MARAIAAGGGGGSVAGVLHEVGHGGLQALRLAEDLGPRRGYLSIYLSIFIYLSISFYGALLRIELDKVLLSAFAIPIELHALFPAAAAALGQAICLRSTQADFLL